MFEPTNNFEITYRLDLEETIRWKDRLQRVI